MYKMWQKLTATMLVTVIMLAEFSLIGIYGGEVKAQDLNDMTNDNYLNQQQEDESGLESQDTKVKNADIRFDAYFKDNQNKVHQANKYIDENNSLFFSLNMGEGYLKNGTISFIPVEEDGEQVRFSIKDGIQSNDIQGIDTDMNVVTLNQINTATTKVVEIPFEFKIDELIKYSGFSGLLKIVLNGTYVNQEAKDVSINKDIYVFLVWKGKIENKGKLTETISKFIPYSVGEQEGILVQETIKAYVDTNPLPVKTTKIEIDVPTINNIKPIDIKVIANTEATNGDKDGVKFGANNYSYNEELNKLTIEVKNNPNQDEKVVWKQNVQDEYKIIYLYPKTAKQAVDNGNVTLARNVKSEISMYSAGTNTKCTNTYSKSESFRDVIGKMIDLIATTNSVISKGQIYANYVAANNDKKEIKYSQNWNIEVSETSLLDEIVVETVEEDLVKNNTQSVLSNQDMYYKKLTISKNAIKNILGNEPQIKIYSGETLIATINSEALNEVENNVEVDLSSYNITGIKIKTNRPVKEGDLSFTIEKAIKKETSKTKAEFEAINKFISTIKVSLFKDEAKILEDSVQVENTLVEPESSATISIDRENLSTVLPNKDVKFTVVLNTNKETNKLYKNPVLYIQLPKEVLDVQLKDVKLLFDEELTIANSSVTTTDNHNKMIVLELSGEQTKYSLGSVTGGTNIVVTADVMVNKLTANKASEILLTYKNENENNLLKNTTTNINFVAPVGVVAVSSIENYGKDKEKQISLSGNNITAEIDRNTVEQNAKFTMSVINNYSNTISNVKILGRVPSQTFDTILQGAIVASKTSTNANDIKIYYSTNKNADKDLTKQSNGWTLNVENFANIKSYLIVLDGDLSTSECIDFEYIAKIPASLDYNQTAVENYTVYFENNLPSGTIADNEESPIISITTGLGPKLEASIVSNIDANTVLPTGNIIKYTVQIKNTGTKEATEVKINFKVPDYTNYIEYTNVQNDLYKIVNPEDGIAQIDVGTIAKGQTVNKDIFVKVNEKSGEVEEFTIKAKAEVVSKEFETALVTNEVLNKAKNAVFYLSLNNGNESITDPLEEGTEFNILFVANTKDSLVEARDTVLEVRIPEGLQYKETLVELKNITTGNTENKEVEANYNSQTRMLSINLGKVENINMNYIYIKTMIENLGENKYSKKIVMSGTIKTNNIKTRVYNEETGREEEKIITREISESTLNKEFELIKEGLEIIQTANIPSGSKISYGEQLLFTIRLRNIGGKDLLVNIKDVLPKELKVLNYSYSAEGNEVKKYNVKNNTIEQEEIVVKKETETIIKITAIAQEVDKDTVVSNILEASTLKLSNVKSNEITYTIEKIKYQDEDPVNPDPVDPEDPEDPVDPEDPDDRKAYVKLSGLVWKDENKNGIKDKDEELLEGIEVALYNVNTNKLYVKDGETLKVRTDDKGIYLFENIPSGKYMVVFMYDTSKYSATLYQNENADEYTNSDAVDKKIKLNGKETVVAITDIITLADKNKYNIDLGLVDNPKFDLKLDMKISKVTVQNKEGTKVYDYNTDLAKVEFSEKTLNGSIIVVEYTIIVTNEGMVDGYVKKIADYLPKELSFSSELNRDWYENENGIIYNASLANTKIMPGETKEVKLYLTKVVNDNSLGTINNNAEIYEAYNDEGIEDLDSTPANKNSSEDDYASSNLVLSIKTGKVVVFIGLTLTIITIISMGAYFIKKKVLR